MYLNLNLNSECLLGLSCEPRANLVCITPHPESPHLYPGIHGPHTQPDTHRKEGMKEGREGGRDGKGGGAHVLHTLADAGP